MAYQLPFFKNYPADWLLSEKIAAMNLAEVGAYKLLIDHQWMGVECTLPDDVDRLKNLARWTDALYGDFARVLACFPKCRRPRERRGNPRLMEEYRQAMALQAVAVTNGQKGAAKRWKKPAEVPVVNGVATWEAYAHAYAERYRSKPVRNRMVNSQLKQFVERLGVDEAPQVAAFYLTHNKPIYVGARHSTNLLLRDAEGLRTEWATGIKSTTLEARSAETVDASQEQVNRVRRLMKGENHGPA